MKRTRLKVDQRPLAHLAKHLTEAVVELVALCPSAPAPDVPFQGDRSLPSPGLPVLLLAFLFPSLRFASLAALAGAQTRTYQFDWYPTLSPLKACHCMELPFVFGNLQNWPDAPMLHGTDPQTFENLSALLRASWIQFIHQGDPSTSIAWPVYDLSTRSTMRFGEIVGVSGDPAGIQGREHWLAVQPGE